MTPLSNNVVKARSLMDCTGICLVADTCLSALYETDDKLCRLNYGKFFSEFIINGGDLSVSSNQAGKSTGPLKSYFITKYFKSFFTFFKIL